jgi:hypothetical protein
LLGEFVARGLQQCGPYILCFGSNYFGLSMKDEKFSVKKRKKKKEASNWSKEGVDLLQYLTDRLIAIFDR